MPDSVQKVRELIKSKTPFIYVVSDEERRVCEEIIQNIAKPLNREVWIWTSNSGLINFETREDKKCKRIEEVVKEIVDMKVSEKKSGAIYLLLDPHIHINPSSARIMKDGYVNIMLGKHKDMIDNPKAYEGKVGSPKNIIFVAGRLAHVSNGIVDGLEPSMKTQIEVVDFPLPTKEELIDLLNKFIASGKKIIKDADFDYSKEDVAEMARSLQGLSFLEAQRAINECIINEKKLSINRLLEKKRCLVRQDDILEVIWNPPSITEVGGLDNLKEFAHMYRGQFSEEAEKFGVQPIRGVLTVGIPGTGKSLAAKAISNLWNLPCLRLDVGKVMAGIVGQSEMRMRQVIKTLEAAAPCVTGDTKVKISKTRDGANSIETTMNKLYNEYHSGNIGPVFYIINGYKSLKVDTVECYGILKRHPGKNRIIEIETEKGNKIKVTENHKLLVIDKQGKKFWKEARDLAINDELVEVSTTNK